MGLARAWCANIRAGNQSFPHQVQEFLEEREREYRITPSPYDSIPDREDVLASRMLLPAGGTQGNIGAGLVELFGADFIEYRPTPVAELVKWPTNRNDDPMNLQSASVARNILQLVDGVSIGLGSPQEVEYTLVDPAAEFDATTGAMLTPLLVGDTLVIQPENFDRAERVVVTAIRKTSPEIPADTQFFFTTTFNNPHDVACAVTSAPWPMWVTTILHSLVKLSTAAAIDAESRRKANDFMRRIVRGVSTWDVCDDSGPFTVGIGKIGVTTIGTT